MSIKLIFLLLVQSDIYLTWAQSSIQLSPSLSSPLSLFLPLSQPWSHTLNPISLYISLSLYSSVSRLSPCLSLSVSLPSISLPLSLSVWKRNRIIPLSVCRISLIVRFTRDIQCFLAFTVAIVNRFCPVQFHIKNRCFSESFSNIIS